VVSALPPYAITIARTISRKGLKIRPSKVDLISCLHSVNQGKPAHRLTSTLPRVPGPNVVQPDTSYSNTSRDSIDPVTSADFDSSFNSWANMCKDSFYYTFTTFRYSYLFLFGSVICPLSTLRTFVLSRHITLIERDLIALWRPRD
jgi:hypothetical protein